MLDQIFWSKDNFFLGMESELLFEKLRNNYIAGDDFFMEIDWKEKSHGVTESLGMEIF